MHNVEAHPAKIAIQLPEGPEIEPHRGSPGEVEADDLGRTKCLGKVRIDARAANQVDFMSRC